MRNAAASYLSSGFYLSNNGLLAAVDHNASIPAHSGSSLCCLVSPVLFIQFVFRLKFEQISAENNVQLHICTALECLRMHVTEYSVAFAPI